MLAVGPTTGPLRGLIPWAQQLFGATAAVPHYNAVFRVMATMAVRWLKIPHLGYFDNFGMIATESTVQDALKAFTALSDILDFDMKPIKSVRGARVEFSWVTVTFIIVDEKCEAQLSTSSNRVEKLVSEISGILGQSEVSLAHMRKLVGKLNFAQTSVMRKVGSAASRPLSDLVMNGGWEIDEKARWSMGWWLKWLPNMAPEIIKPLGRAVVVGIYSDACATEGGAAAVALFARGEDGFAALLMGNAEPLPLEH